MEDFFLIADDWSAFAVADGITRDRYPVSELRSGASRAAELFCREVLRGVASEGDAVSTLRSASAARTARFGISTRKHSAILRLTFSTGTSSRASVRPLYFATVPYTTAAWAIVVLPYSRLPLKRSLKRRTTSFRRRRISPNSSSPARKRSKLFARSKLRNNPAAENHDGKKVGYGAMTGEESASAFFRFGSSSAEPGWYALLYSDGFAELLASAPFTSSAHACSRTPAA